MIDLCSLLDYATIISFLQPPEMKADPCYGRALEEAYSVVAHARCSRRWRRRTSSSTCSRSLRGAERRRIRRIRERRRNGEEEGTVSGNDDEEDEDDVENDDEDCCYFFSEFLAAAGRGRGRGPLSEAPPAVEVGRRYTNRGEERRRWRPWKEWEA